MRLSVNWQNCSFRTGSAEQRDDLQTIGAMSDRCRSIVGSLSVRYRGNIGGTPCFGALFPRFVACMSQKQTLRHILFCKIRQYVAILRKKM